MPEFSAVDDSADIDRLVSCLETTDTGLGPMKAYMTSAFKRAVREGIVVDIGCGIGHDLSRLGAAGLRPIGLDVSARLLARVKHGAALVQGDAGHLPFRDASIDGCRAERVLLHVADPRSVIQEVARVLRRDGLLAVFEPDWTTLEIESGIELGGPPLGQLLDLRHPNVGGDVAVMAHETGFQVCDLVTESSRAYALEDVPFDVVALALRGRDEGLFDSTAASAWITEQRQRSQISTFKASWDKVLVLARRL